MSLSSLQGSGCRAEHSAQTLEGGSTDPIWREIAQRNSCLPHHTHDCTKINVHKESSVQPTVFSQMTYPFNFAATILSESLTAGSLITMSTGLGMYSTTPSLTGCSKSTRRLGWAFTSRRCGRSFLSINTSIPSSCTYRIGIMFILQTTGVFRNHLEAIDRCFQGVFRHVRSSLHHQLGEKREDSLTH